MKKYNPFFIHLLASFSLLGLLFLLQMGHSFWGFSIGQWGIRPGSISGLFGIFTAPFFHSDWIHLLSNSLPLFILLNVILNLYVHLAYWSLLGIVLLSGAGVWVLGSPASSHIGISGLIYGMIGFLLAAGIIGGSRNSLRITFITALLYGGFVWGFLPRQGISWESHLSGFLSGLLMALFFLKNVKDNEVHVSPAELEYAFFFEEVEKKGYHLPDDPPPHA